MKRLLLSLLLIFTLCTVFAQDKQAILNVLETQRQAWNRGDIDGFMQGYWKSDSLTFVGKTVPVYGWQTTLDNYKSAIPAKLLWVSWHSPLLNCNYLTLKMHLCLADGI